MTQRYTKHDVLAAFIRLTNSLNVPVYIDKGDLARYYKRNEYAPKPAQLSPSYHGQIGVWALAKGYSGYQFERMENKGGGISHPISYEVMNARRFCDAVFFYESVQRYQQSLDAKTPTP